MGVEAEQTNLAPKFETQHQSGLLLSAHMEMQKGNETQQEQQQQRRQQQHNSSAVDAKLWSGRRDTR